MKLYIAGGVYEHGRNCFYISRENERNVMVDCGVKAGSTDYYPLLDEWQKKEVIYSQPYGLMENEKIFP